jgi:alpha,alpha-trehalase
MDKNKKNNITKEDLTDILSFVNNKWAEFEVRSPENATKKGKDPFDVLYLPNPYIVPNSKKFDVMFYWDSFFTIQGLKLHKDKKDLIKGIVDNLLYEIDTFGMALNANRKKWSNRSQLPYLTSMIIDVYSFSKDKKWLKKAYKTVKKEYSGYWLNRYHKFNNGLSRFYSQSPDDKEHSREYKSRAEASWDMSPRFSDEDIHNLIPVDLNINLYKYEKDFAFFEKILGYKNYLKWSKIADKRKKIIQSLCWNDKDGLFYDYDIKKQKQKMVKSLAGFQALFFGFAEKEQALRMSKSLKYFKANYSIAACSEDYSYKDRQWNWPYVWAPLIYILFEGFTKYGYKKEADDIAKDFIYLVIKNFKKTGYIWEKYNGITGTPAMVYDRYENQEGFSWTNAVFEYLVFKLYGKVKLH